MPVRLSLTEGTVADCTQASDLIADLAAQFLLADRAYDTDAIIAEALAQGMEPVIPPKKNRKEPREYDRYLYKLRHLVENAVLEFNGGGWQPAMPRTPRFLARLQWSSGLTTRPSTTTTSCLVGWLDR